MGAPADTTPIDLPLTAPDLANPVTRALGVGHVDLVDWTVESMKAGTGGATGGLYRVRGSASATEVPHEWGLVLKVLRPQAGRLSTQGNVAAANGREPHHYNYWLREALAYQSGVLEAVTAVRAPRCYGVEEQADGSIWVWLEALDDGLSPPWPAERFARVARRLGRFNGSFLASGAPLPDHEWLSRGWLRSWLARWTTVTESAVDQQSWADPRVRRAFGDPDEAFARMARLAGAHQALLGVLERLPQTLAHQDAFSRNIMFASDEQIVLIDWAFVGHAAAGEEVAQLVAGTMLFGDADRLAAREIGTASFESYVEGLRGAGWKGDPQLVRFGYATAAALRWGAFAVANVMRVAMADDERRARIESDSGQTLEKTVASYAALATYLLELGDEAITGIRDWRYHGREKR